jgi:dihydroorotate dehydrogenase electron transfer subunit
LELELPEAVDFLPGQFAMLNLTGRQERVFARPFSLLAATGPRVAFLFQVVGEVTRHMASLAVGQPMTFLGPLGRSFPSPGELPVLLVAGGVGLPPLYVWWRRFGRQRDRALFGARSADRVPWELVESGWEVALQEPADGLADPQVFTGLVTELWQERGPAPEAGPFQVFGCGPVPMLRATAEIARQYGWACWVSVEEHMGCGYGVCRGCVVPATDSAHLAACQDGPVLAADRIDWKRFTGPGANLRASSGERSGGGDDK